MVSASRVLAEELTVGLFRDDLRDCSVALVDNESFRVAGDGRADISGLVGPTSCTAASLDAVATSWIVSPSWYTHAQKMHIQLFVEYRMARRERERERETVCESTWSLRQKSGQQRGTNVLLRIMNEKSWHLVEWLLLLLLGHYHPPLSIYYI